MTGARGEGRGSKDGSAGDLDQIEYLLFQSTQGIHFIFDHSDVATVLRVEDDGAPLDIKLMDKVQGLLSGLLAKVSMTEKRSFVDSLAPGDYALLVKAYFKLVDKTILASSQLRH